jgi:hypothetical protein
MIKIEIVTGQKDPPTIDITPPKLKTKTPDINFQL